MTLVKKKSKVKIIPNGFVSDWVGLLTKTISSPHPLIDSGKVSIIRKSADILFAFAFQILIFEVRLIEYEVIVCDWYLL